MSLTDYTSRKFRDHRGRPCEIQFRADDTEDILAENPIGQVVATVSDHGAPDHGQRHPVSRPHVQFQDTERALADLGSLPYRSEHDHYSVQIVVDRLAAAGLL